MKKPVIGITMGDPAGIGPEIIVKALVSESMTGRCSCIVFGDSRILQMALAITKTPASLHVIHDISDAVFLPGSIEVMDFANVDPDQFHFGRVDAQCGRAAYEYIEKAIFCAMDGQLDAIATTPINKESIHAANVPYIGHTEIFGSLTGTADPLTMFETNNLRIFFFTRHLSLRDMLDRIKKEPLKDFARTCRDALHRLGIQEGTMAVAGLNPHCGEHGLFGDEEIREIAPAVEELRSEGMDIQGPIGADSVFHQAAMGRFNCVLSLYHDQGHIAAKTLDFDRTISVTNGMPILRTSVDHGTAFDIAGKNMAGEISMIEAILIAAKYAPYYTR